MKFCCTKCFNDKYFEISDIPFQKTGKCYYCGTENAKLINPVDLKIHFDGLIDLYEPNGKNGKLLFNQISSDWNIFSNKIPRNLQKELFYKICLCPDHKKYALRGIDDIHKKAEINWKNFSDEIKYKNRFIISNTQIFDILDEFSYLFSLKDIPSVFYRARKMENFNEFNENDMLKPPKEKTTNGRANPKGIPYFYVASDSNTAIHEIRPHRGDIVCVAKIKATNIPKLKILDLRCINSYNFSPFEENEDAEELINALAFMKLFAKKLALPIISHQKDFDYLPTQYLCEKIKSLNWSGIAYKSSASSEKNEGYNIVFFNDADFKIIKYMKNEILETKIKSKLLK